MQFKSIEMQEQFQSTLQTLLPRNPKPVIGYSSQKSVVQVKVDLDKYKKIAETMMWGYFNADKEQLQKIKKEAGFAMLNYFDMGKEAMIPAVPHHMVRGGGHKHRPVMSNPNCKTCRELAIRIRHVRSKN